MPAQQVESLNFYELLKAQFERWLETDEGQKTKYAKHLVLMPEFFRLLLRLIFDPKTPAEAKGRLALAVAYCVSPYDFIPEAVVGPAGYLDDLAVAAQALSAAERRVGATTIQKHWGGEGDPLVHARQILLGADEMVGRNRWEKIRSFLGTK